MKLPPASFPNWNPVTVYLFCDFTVLCWIWEFWVVGVNRLEINKVKLFELVDLNKILETKKKLHVKLFVYCEISSVCKSKGSSEVASH